MSLITAGVDMNVLDQVRHRVSLVHLLAIFYVLSLSFITQYERGESALMMAVRDGRTEVVSLLVKAGANTDLQNKVVSCMRGCGGSTV